MEALSYHFLAAQMYRWYIEKTERRAAIETSESRRRLAQRRIAAWSRREQWQLTQHQGGVSVPPRVGKLALKAHGYWLQWREAQAAGNQRNTANYARNLFLFYTREAGYALRRHNRQQAASAAPQIGLSPDA